jgi:hypothetical protein
MHVQARPQLRNSTVVDSLTGEFKQSEVRTSSGAAFGRGYDDVLKRIERRIASVTMIPVGAVFVVVNCRRGGAELFGKQLWWLAVPATSYGTPPLPVHAHTHTHRLAATWGLHAVELRRTSRP